MKTDALRFLASYPKSGNTWARLFLLNWYMDADAPVEPEMLARKRFIPGCDTDWLWEDATGQTIDKLGVVPSFRLRHHVQWFYQALEGDYPAFLKTHSANISFGVFPQINWDATGAAVYFIRDPRKVAPSMSDHYQFDLDTAIKMMADGEYVSGREEKIFTWIGDWSGHVRGWRDRATVIRYEDLPDGFEAMLEAFGLPMDERFEKAKEFTKLKTLKAIEGQRGFSERAHEGHRFFGGERPHITGAQVEKIESDHEEIMREHGYI